MKRLYILLALMVAFSFSGASQERQLTKMMWAQSFLGEKAPELVVEKWITPKPDLNGKYILLEFWATYCGPCRKAIPKLNELQKRFADKLVVIGLSDEKEDKVKDMISPKMEYTSAIDTRALLKSKYKVKGIPHAVLISPEGMVIWEGFPLLPGYELTEELVDELINKK